MAFGLAKKTFSFAKKHKKGTVVVGLTAASFGAGAYLGVSKTLAVINYDPTAAKQHRQTQKMNRRAVKKLGKNLNKALEEKYARKN